MCINIRELDFRGKCFALYCFILEMFRTTPEWIDQQIQIDTHLWYYSPHATFTTISFHIQWIPRIAKVYLLCNNIYSSRIHCVSTECDQKSTIENDWITFSKNKKSSRITWIRLEIQIYRLVYFRKLTEKDEPPKKGNEVFKKKF